MIWRSAIVAAYLALAILVGVSAGARGLAILLFFYLAAGGWALFLLVGGWAARAAGRWNFRRLERAVPAGDEADDVDCGGGDPEEAALPGLRVERAPAPAAKRRPAPAL